VVRAGPIIGTDDTTVTLVTKDSPLPGDDDNPKNVRARELIAAAQAESRRSITARMGGYRSITVPINVFDFTIIRHRDGPELFLDGFTGSLMADCYAGYGTVETKSAGRIIRVGPVAGDLHSAARREPNHNGSLAQQIYRLEDWCRGQFDLLRLFLPEPSPPVVEGGDRYTRSIAELGHRRA